MAETKFQRLVRALLKPFPTLERAAQQMHTMRLIDNATGETLTMLGRIVGQPRSGVADDDLFRRYVRARVAVNSSDGVGEDIYGIARLIVTEEGATFELDNQGTAAFAFRVEDASLSWDVAEVLISFLRNAVAAGVRIVLEWWPEGVDETNVFEFETFVPGGGAGLGYESFDTLTGGRFISAIE